MDVSTPENRAMDLLFDDVWSSDDSVFVLVVVVLLDVAAKGSHN
jgi:hypothetical protein